MYASVQQKLGYPLLEEKTTTLSVIAHHMKVDHWNYWRNWYNDIDGERAKELNHDNEDKSEEEDDGDDEEEEEGKKDDTKQKWKGKGQE